NDCLERHNVQLHQRLLDNWLHFTVATFPVHHLGAGHTACNPFFGRRSSLAYRRHVTGRSVSNQCRCCITQRVAVVSVEVRRSSATSFVTGEVVLCSKLAYELALFFPLSQLSANHFGQQLFCFNQR